MFQRKPSSGVGRAGHVCNSGAGMVAECGTNICVGEWELIQPSSPYNAVMDLSWRCEICDIGGRGREGPAWVCGFDCG